MVNIQNPNHSSTSRQLARFDELWRATCENPTQGRVDNLTEDDLFWTILFRLPSGSLQNSDLAAVISQLQSNWPQHQFYAQEQYHITVLGLGKREAWNCRDSSLRCAVDRAAQEFKVCPLRLVGLNVLTDTLVAQAIDATGELSVIAEALSNHCKSLTAGETFTPGLHKELWWITLARFHSPVSDDLLSFVAEHRSADFGSVQMDRLTLVETTKTFNLAQTRTIHDVMLEVC